MIKKCNFCGNTSFKKKNVTYICKKDDKVMFFNNVPCEECDYCHEQYFRASVLKKIENEYNKIYLQGIKPSNVISVPVGNFMLI